MKEKLAAAAIAESEAVKNMAIEENDLDEENSTSEPESRNTPSGQGSPSSLVLKSDEGQEVIGQNTSSDCDLLDKYKKNLSGDSGNEASSEDSNDSKGGLQTGFGGICDDV